LKNLTSDWLEFYTSILSKVISDCIGESYEFSYVFRDHYIQLGCSSFK
jgi:hypothetical protein